MFSLSDYTYDLPEELIAQIPISPAHDAKLLTCTPTGFFDHHFFDLPSILPANSLLFLNNSYVIKARIPLQQVGGMRKKEHGMENFLLKKGEVLVYKVYENEETIHIRAENFLPLQKGGTYFECLVSDAKHFRPGTTLFFDENHIFESLAFTENGICMRRTGSDTFFSFLEEYAEMPLPPYISYEKNKEKDYQTIFANARKKGSVAAPTAGLHFTEDLLVKIAKKGIDIHYITLHVGLGTFKPLRHEDIRDHDIHEETAVIPISLFETIMYAKQKKLTITGVGTTVTRVLESLPFLRIELKKTGNLHLFSPETQTRRDTMETSTSQGKDIVANSTIQNEEVYFTTRIYIYPGFQRQIIDTLITNFHLPKTSLLLLVASFMGHEQRKKSYIHAVANNYRFYSFGDGMLLQR